MKYEELQRMCDGLQKQRHEDFDRLTERARQMDALHELVDKLAEKLRSIHMANESEVSNEINTIPEMLREVIPLLQKGGGNGYLANFVTGYMRGKGLQ